MRNIHIIVCACGISKDLDYCKQSKKFIENGFRVGDLTGLSHVMVDNKNR